MGVSSVHSLVLGERDPLPPCLTVNPPRYGGPSAVASYLGCLAWTCLSCLGLLTWMPGRPGSNFFFLQQGGPTTDVTGDAVYSSHGIHMETSRILRTSRVPGFSETSPSRVK